MDRNTYRPGDKIESVLSAIGITSERVSRWLGRPCGCQERRDKLNALQAWSTRVLQGKVADAKNFLQRIMGS